MITVWVIYNPRLWALSVQVPVTVRNGTHKLVVEGLVRNKAPTGVMTGGSDVSAYASYLPIYHNESAVVFQQKYVSLFITLDNMAYVAPADSSGIYKMASKRSLVKTDSYMYVN